VEMEFCGSLVGIRKEEGRAEDILGLDAYVDGGEMKNNKEETPGHQSWRALEELGSMSAASVSLSGMHNGLNSLWALVVTDGLFVITDRLGSWLIV
jgi:hypothetical protein